MTDANAHRPTDQTPALPRVVAVITRPARSDAMAAAFIAAGARVELIPVTRLAVNVDLDLLAIKLAKVVSTGGWLILPSPSAIEILLVAAKKIPDGKATLSRIRIAAIGPSSAELLAQSGLADVFTPPEPNAASLARTLPAGPGAHVLIAGSELSRAELLAELGGREISAENFPLYRPVPDAPQLTRLHKLLLAAPDPLKPVRMVVVTAPSAVDAIAGKMTETTWRAAGWLAIGPTTMARLKDHLPAVAHAAQAETPDADALVRAASGLIEGRKP
ncbi:uroporphyrinogen-III synthase [bacterium]|nr:uroporphyrinogen-III synthase [bacterium]